MAANWPPAAGTYPAWPPAELKSTRLEVSSLPVAISLLQTYGFTRRNPTAAENSAFFRNVRCDHGDPCQGIMIVSPGGLAYPFAYCTGATHKAALAPYVVGYNTGGNPQYELGCMSADL